MLPQTHPENRGMGVGMVGKTHDEGVKAVGELLKELAVVLELPGLRERFLGRSLAQNLIVNVAEGNHIAQAGGSGGIERSLGAQSEACKPKSVVRAGPCQSRRLSSAPESHPQEGGIPEELPATARFGHETSLLDPADEIGGRNWRGGEPDRCRL